MDGSMRDLNLIREQKDEQDGMRRMALLAVSGLAGGGLVLVLSLVAAPPPPAETPTRDPLARLSIEDGLAAETIEESTRPSIDRVALTFPERLEGDPPELAAAIAAANAELLHPEPLPVRPAMLAGAIAGERAAAALPAAMVATIDAARLEGTSSTDVLVSAALPAERTRMEADAPAGHDGEFTLQVISYDSPEGAQAFAEGLRARGHRAFVMRATIEGRGTVHRVRIGPFESMGEAQRYRTAFEATEHMNTIVIRRRDS
jgi:cell division septation protein DedD